MRARFAAFIATCSMLLCCRAASAQTQTVGRFAVTLRPPADGVVAREEVEIELRIADVTRPDPLTEFAPVIRAVVEASIDMPSMPSMPRYQETAHAEAVPGDYGIHPTFAHGGSYRLRLSIRPPGEAEPIAVEFVLAVQDVREKQDAREKQRRKRQAVAPRYSVELSTNPKRPRAGEPVELRFAFRDREQPKQIFHAFETVHESLFHLIVVRSDLAQFAHEHPRIEPDGTFVLRYTFAAGGEYRLFADVAPARAGSQVLEARLAVSGPSGERFQIQTAERRQRSAADSHTWIEIDRAAANAEPLAVRKTITLPVRILDAVTGQPPSDLGPYLGANGHFLLVHADGETFVHSHPSDGDAPASPRFLVRFPKPGLYRGWVQVQRAGRVLTADFVLLAGDAGEGHGTP